MDRRDRPDLQQRAERASAALRRLRDLAEAVLRGVRLLAVVAAGVVTVAWGAWLLGRVPDPAAGWGRALATLAVLLAPPGVLWVFFRGLRELQELPRRARRLPAEVRERSGDLWRQVRSAPDPDARATGLVCSAFRFAWLVLTSRDLLMPYAAASPALRPALLVAAVLAAVLAAIEIVVGILALPLLPA